MKSSLGLLLQNLPHVGKRVLLAAYVAEMLVLDRTFSSKSLLQLFDRLRVPRPENIHQVLQRLKRKSLVVRQEASSNWAVTPIGREKALELVENLDQVALETQLVGMPGSDFGHARHAVISPAFAPAKWSVGISRLLQDYPFEQNVFLMTRFPKEDGQGALAQCIVVLREALQKHGLHLHLASDRQLDDDLLGNVAAHMWACNYGIGILEKLWGEGINYNVMTEIGAMLMTGRRCALFKDESIPNLPTDISGQIYRTIDLETPQGIAKQAHRWAANDLGLGKCKMCPRS